MQSLPLDAKIEMTKRRIQEWYDSWTRYTIVNKSTGSVRYATCTQEPNPDGCFYKKEKIINGEKVYIDTLISGTKLSPVEYVESGEPGQVYVSISGGKDSTVLNHIVMSMYSDVPALFINTGLEYPEIQKFAMKQPNVVTVRPAMRFDEVIKKYGYPIISKEVAQKVYEVRSAERNGYKDSYALRKFNGTYISKNGKTGPDITKWAFLLDAPFNISHKCCNVMKKQPAIDYEIQTGRKPILGTMACESQLRSLSWVEHGCNAFNINRPSSKPMSFWTDQDVLAYIKKFDLEYCSVYGDIEEISVIENGKIRNEYRLTGCNRTGCVFCGFGCHMNTKPTNFQRLKHTHPRLYDYCINGGEYIDGVWTPNKLGLGLGKVLDYIGVNYEPVEKDETMKLF